MMFFLQYEYYSGQNTNCQIRSTAGSIVAISPVETVCENLAFGLNGPKGTMEPANSYCDD